MYFSEKHHNDLLESFRKVGEALQELARCIVDAFAKFFVHLRSLSSRIDELLAQFRIEPEPPKHIPPRLSLPSQSWAYYSARVHNQPKRAFRQERIWRHRG